MSTAALTLTQDEARELGGFLLGSTYTLDHISEAHRYVEEGCKRGNVVVVVAQG